MPIMLTLIANGSGRLKARSMNTIPKIALALVSVLIISTSACSKSDPEEVRAAILTSSDPSSDVLYVIEAIEAANDACLLEQGIEPVPPGSRISNMVLDGEVSIQGLPPFRHLDGKVIGYTTDLEERHIEHRQAYNRTPGDDLISPDPEDQIDGWTLLEEDREPEDQPRETIPVISYEVPMIGSFGILMEGCVGQSLETVVPDEYRVDYLVGSTLLDYLAFRIHSKALDRTSGMHAWRECMQDEGFDVKSPFNILKFHDYEPAEVAPADARCREHTGVDEAYLSQVDRELRRVSASALAALEDLDRVTREIRLAQ